MSPTTEYSVYTIDNPPSSCIECSFLSVKTDRKVTPFLITPPIKDENLNEYLINWFEKRYAYTTYWTTCNDVKEKISTYLADRRSRAKTTEYKVEVTNCSEQISGLLVNVQIIPCIEDPDLKEYVREITTSDNTIIDAGRLIESRIREWQANY